jgi:septal ring factor EnvC (AmiA/AmiB activator)
MPSISELKKASEAARRKSEEARAEVDKKEREYDKDWAEYQKVKTKLDSSERQQSIDDLRKDHEDFNKLLDEWSLLSSKALVAEKAYYDAIKP